MMAFFMVMWIIGMDEKTKKAIEGYFSNPVGFKKGYSSGSSPLASGASPAAVQREAIAMAFRKMQERRYQEARTVIMGRVDSLASIGGKQALIEISVTRAGLRVEL